MRKIIVSAVIVLLFVLAHDFWVWDETVLLGPAGLPRWIYVFASLQLALSLVIYWYTRQSRSAEDEG